MQFRLGLDEMIQSLGNRLGKLIDELGNSETRQPIVALVMCLGISLEMTSFLIHELVLEIDLHPQDIYSENYFWLE